MANTNEKAMALRATVLEAARKAYDGVAKQTESPIEELVYWALCATQLGGYARASDNREWGAPSWFRIAGGLEDITFFPQSTVEAGGAKYRLDFLAQSSTTGPTSNGGTQEISVRFAIECDGHDFHERTKEQARRDRKRDRDLQAAGYRVLRFTGSEIHRDPSAVAQEIVDAVDREIQAKYTAAFDAYQSTRKGGE